MAQVYSVRFAQNIGPTATTSFTVPPAKRAVVRGLSYVSISGGSKIWVWLREGYVFMRDQPGANTGGFQELRLVAYAGELIALVTEGTDTRAQLSGFLFDDPGGGREAAQQPAGPQLPDPPAAPV